MKRDILTELKQYEKGRGLDTEALAHLAEKYGKNVAEVYAVSTFYTETSSPRRGKYKICLCRSLPCRMKNMDDVLLALKEELGIVPESCTEDETFSLHLVNCIGACDRAPAMLVNGELYGDLTSKKIRKIVRGLQQRQRMDNDGF